MSSEEPVRRQIVLCFDGTGNTFRTDGADTNILKIYRMLTKSDDTISYYQPGIGTDITPGSLASTTLKHGSRFGKSKTMRQALGKSFEQHVLGGYRFLMRHYKEDTDIYILGFSRGAYTACFLAEMLEYAGLLGPDNEEMIPFIWKAFSEFKLVRYENDPEKKEKAYRFLYASRETMCRATARVKFLGVFDTVNSVAEFEVDNRFGGCASIIRHAVSIDERRVKFQPVLLKKARKRTYPGAQARYSSHHRKMADAENPEPENHDDKTEGKRPADEPEVDEIEVWFPGAHADVGGGNELEENCKQLSHAPLVWMVQEATKAGLRLYRERIEQYGCFLELPDDEEDRVRYLEILRQSSRVGKLNDQLKFRDGGAMALAWNILEHTPIKHLEIQPDGSVAKMHFPLHRGEPRGIPMDALVHVSAIDRMEHNEDYRPGNLIVGGEGRGIIKAPPGWGIGNWVAKYHIGDPAQELYVRNDSRSG